MNHNKSFLFSAFFGLVFSAVLIPSASADEIEYNITTNVFSSYELAGGLSHMPLELWLVLFGLAVVFLLAGTKWKLSACADLHSVFAALLFFICAITSFWIQKWEYVAKIIPTSNTSAEFIIQPVYYQYPAWLCLLCIMFGIVSILNAYRIYLQSIEQVSKKMDLDRKRADEWD